MNIIIIEFVAILDYTWNNKTNNNNNNWKFYIKPFNITINLNFQKQQMHFYNNL